MPDLATQGEARPSETIVLPARGRPIDRRKSLMVGAVCWLGFLAIAVMVETGQTSALDKFGLLFWRGGAELAPRGPQMLLEAVRDITALGGVLLRNLFGLAAIAALLFLRLRREAVLFAATVMLGWIVNSGVKLLVGRARPEIVPHLTEAGGASFPSGHSFNSAVVYVAMAIAFATLSARESVRMTVLGGALVGSLVIAWSRVWLGVHFPSDVLAGWLGGVGWAFVASVLFYKSAQAAADSPRAEQLDPTRPHGTTPGAP